MINIYAVFFIITMLLLRTEFFFLGGGGEERMIKASLKKLASYLMAVRKSSSTA
jgi:hypothetical protein